MTELRHYRDSDSDLGATMPRMRRTGREDFRTGREDFGGALQGAVRDNPVSAALIGMGVLWLFMGGTDTSLFGGRGRKSIFRTAAQGAGQVGEVVGEAVRDAASVAGSSVSRAASAAGEILSQTGQVVRQASAAAGEAVNAVSSACGATTEMASRSADTISNTTAAVQERGLRLGSAIQQNLSDAFERQPLLLGAVGLAIGAGIAASIPTTQMEERVMGEASNTVKDAVAEKLAQVKATAEAAVEEAKAQGLTPGAATAALRTKGDEVAEAAAKWQSDGPHSASASATSRH